MDQQQPGGEEAISLEDETQEEGQPDKDLFTGLRVFLSSDI